MLKYHCKQQLTLNNAYCTYNCVIRESYTFFSFNICYCKVSMPVHTLYHDLLFFSLNQVFFYEQLYFSMALLLYAAGVGCLDQQKMRSTAAFFSFFPSRDTQCLLYCNKGCVRNSDMYLLEILQLYMLYANKADVSST